jgi:hypothetical protein
LHGGIAPAPDHEFGGVVVTEDDYIGYLPHGEVGGAIPVALAAKLRRSHFLFLGYGMREWGLRLVLDRMCAGQPLEWRSWAVLPDVRPLEREFWRSRDIELFELPLRGVRHRARSLRGCRSRGDAGVSLVAVALRSPFKGLAAFDDSEIDALLFFGRERETEEIVANLLASDLTVLYGPSGVGKSSILRAGVSRRLRELAGDAEVVIRDEWSADPSLPKPAGEAFLILDQLEEYFLYHDEGPLLEQLPVLLAQPRVHVLISLREDALAQLDTLELRVPNVFSNRLRLGHLDALAARAAIVRPLDSWNAVAEPADQMKIEAALVDAVLTQVAIESETQGASASARIEAPYLQLV